MAFDLSILRFGRIKSIWITIAKVTLTYILEEEMLMAIGLKQVLLVLFPTL
jgi:hypothetical protein